MIKIIGLSGKKQAGKNTCCKMIQSIYEDTYEFNFADGLKKMCMEVLGLTEAQCYGTDADKNSLVEHLLWEKFPIPFFDDSNSDTNGEIWVHLQTEEDSASGPMTAREVMQYYGTNIFRAHYSNVWSDACIRKIKNIAEDGDIAVICDCRYPNEVEAIQNAGGKVIRLTRQVDEDTHISETALDGENFDWSKFDIVFDNADMTILEQSVELYHQLHNVGILPGVAPEIVGWAAREVQEKEDLINGKPVSAY